MNQANAEIAEQAKLDPVLITSVAGIPGYKSLTWVRGISPRDRNGVVDPNRIGVTFDPEARKAAEH